MNRAQEEVLVPRSKSHVTLKPNQQSAKISQTIARCTDRDQDLSDSGVAQDLSTKWLRLNPPSHFAPSFFDSGVAHFISGKAGYLGGGG